MSLRPAPRRGSGSGSSSSSSSSSSGSNPDYAVGAGGGALGRVLFAEGMCIVYTVTTNQNLYFNASCEAVKDVLSDGQLIADHQCYFTSA
jgi:hypothetical protein